MPVWTPLGQGLSAQLLVEEGNGKPLHHHPSSHFPSLDDTGVSPLSVITDLPYGRALIIIRSSIRFVSMVIRPVCLLFWTPTDLLLKNYDDESLMTDMHISC